MTEPQTPHPLVALEHEWTDAMRRHDADALKRLTTEDLYLGIAVAGQPLKLTARDAWLASLPAYEMRRVQLDDIVVHTYGETAVVTLQWTQEASVNGKDRSGTFFITDIWVNQNDTWRVRQRFSSRPEPATAARPV